MAYRFLSGIAALTAVSLAFHPAQAQSIAAVLPAYQKTLSIASVAGVTASSFSGVALHQANSALFVVDNGNANVYELTVTGTVVRTISTSGITDPEGIGYYRLNTFFIAEEGKSNILRVDIPATGTGPLDWSSVPALNLASNWGNTGVEGISYCGANNTLYAVKEINPPRLYRITLDNTGAFQTSYENDPFNIESNAGDAADIYALSDGNFIIVNQEQNRLEGYGPNGEPLSRLSLGMTKPEGIAIDTADGTIYIVGEPREFCVFKKPISPALEPVDCCKGYSVKTSPSGLPGRPIAMTISVPRRSAVSIECILLNGRHSQLLESVFEKGAWLMRPKLPGSAAGIRLLCISTGPFKKIIACSLP
jgi:uncharacterized protein YjiK